MKSFPWHLAVRFFMRRFGEQLDTSGRGFHLTFGTAFDKLVAHDLERNPPSVSGGGVIAFTSAALDTFRVARKMGLCPVLEQIDPALTELEIVRQEAELWPGWEIRTDSSLEPIEYWNRIREEWDTATWIVVNSDFSRTALVEQGVDPGKLIVIPLAYESPFGSTPTIKPKIKTLKVLWLGTVILRKGIQYLREAAKLLGQLDVEFIIAGPIGIKADRMAEFPPNFRFIGKPIREEKQALYRESDLFVLPTISDGFAITQLEAMSHGLPVLTTPNCGRVVTDGVDGYIVPIRSGEAIAERIERLYKNRGTLADMSRAALEKSAEFSIDKYADRLEEHIVRKSAVV